MNTELDCTKYAHFVEQFKAAYRRAGFLYEPGVWYDQEYKLAHPVAMLAVDSEGIDAFKSFGGKFINDDLMVKWFEKTYMRGNWLWCYGFLGAIAKSEKQPFKDNESSDCGWKVGKEVRKRLLEWNRDVRRQLRELCPNCCGVS